MIRRLIADALEDLAGWLEKQGQRLDPPQTVTFSLEPFEPREYDWRKAPEEPPPARDLGSAVSRWRRMACADTTCLFVFALEGEWERYTIHWNTHHREGRS